MSTCFKRGGDTYSSLSRYGVRVGSILYLGPVSKEPWIFGLQSLDPRFAGQDDLCGLTCCHNIVCGRRSAGKGESTLLVAHVAALWFYV